MRGSFVAGGALVLSVLATPALAQTVTDTVSDGEMHVFDYVYDGRRNDSFQTRFVGLLDGEVMFDQTFFRGLDDIAVQAFLADLAEPRAHVVDGAPGVLTWSPPELVDQYEELLDVFTEISTSTTSTSVVTVQWTSGDGPDPVVQTGARGLCYDTGADGPTNYGDMSGAFATCDYFDEHVVAPGELNRNTHTTFIYTTVETSFTNEDWLIVSNYQLVGEVRLIGVVHGAARTAMFESGAAFLDAVDGRDDRAQPDRATRLWAGGYGGRAETPGVGRVAGSERRSDGLQGGVDWALGPWRLGLAFDHGETRIETPGEPEAAELSLTQAATRAGAQWPGGWFVSAVATAGRGDVEARHGDASIGGVSTAAYDVRTRGASVSAGRRLEAGGWSVAPALGYDHVWARSDAFTETGGIALAAEESASRRDSVWAGLGVARRLRLGQGAVLDLGARARAYKVVDGQERSLPVVMVDLPDTPLTLHGAPEHGRGVALGLDAALELRGGLVLFASGDRVEAGGDEASRWRAGLRLRW